mgnify:CR=1 FL=1
MTWDTTDMVGAFTLYIYFSNAADVTRYGQLLIRDAAEAGMAEARALRNRLKDKRKQKSQKQRRAHAEVMEALVRLQGLVDGQTGLVCCGGSLVRHHSSRCERLGRQALGFGQGGAGLVVGFTLSKPFTERGAGGARKVSGSSGNYSIDPI